MAPIRAALGVSDKQLRDYMEVLNTPKDPILRDQADRLVEYYPELNDAQAIRVVGYWVMTT